MSRDSVWRVANPPQDAILPHWKLDARGCVREMLADLRLAVSPEAIIAGSEIKRITGGRNRRAAERR
jgi:hypothetical protein